ncbi:MAG TPA: M2 family metallopeptidase, partial [Thermoanaerobaculia bacterium]|nr:M2 family metallopeptidase [Thermoanaerobaculia bacterium]
MTRFAAVVCICVLAAAPVASAQDSPPTAVEAAEFVAEAEARLLELAIDAERHAWIQATYITYDSQLLAAQAGERLTEAVVRYATEAARYDDVEVPADVRRKLGILKTGITMPAPRDPEKVAELTKIASNLEAAYGTGKYCPEEGSALAAAAAGLAAEAQGAEGAGAADPCLALGELEGVIGRSEEPQALLEAWTGWRTVSPPMRDQYRRFVELMNEGARGLGYADTGALWRSGYDVPPDDFAREVDRLWGQVRPLYDALHCFVRAELSEQYGPEVVPPQGMIPAHLVGNMWAQSWLNLVDQVAPEGAEPAFNLTAILQAEGFDARKMVETGEAFFTSLGFEPLPDTFWERSLFTKPRDREVVCHASAWDVDNVDDLRIKMCIEVDEEDFITVHHELGHNFYQRAYNRQPFLYRDGAHDGFHEAIGDAIALSITPEYLQEIGLLDEVPDESADLGLLLARALDRVAFLPFGLLVDQWRWKVFSGEIAPDAYNKGWWDLRAKYQGVAPPVERTEEHFDPGAKFHVPGNTPYTRYFLAHILQ